MNSKSAKLRSRNQVTLPPEICEEAGMREGDTLRATVHRKGQRVPEGAIVLTPMQAEPGSVEDWRRREAEADAEIAAGRTHGPFELEDALKYLKKDSKRRQIRS
jgi:bifunctional DNA-binding transcriptional regulator/antitoxin component of YhaV-PrlF toxin-antitoxin module